jgi:pimeloyl-ACP methyl ester carboxylesterase
LLEGGQEGYVQFKSLLLIHGAGSGPWIFDQWRRCFGSIDVRAVDLLAGVDVEDASMVDYARAVEAAADGGPRPRACCGWSMGGLVAMMAQDHFDALVLIEPSPPAEIQGHDRKATALPGTFDPEEVYVRFPAGIKSRPESNRARVERKQGISIPSLDRPSLVVYGHEFAEDRGRAVADLYGSDAMSFPGYTHWDLVLRHEVRDAILEWLSNVSLEDDAKRS